MLAIYVLKKTNSNKLSIRNLTREKTPRKLSPKPIIHMRRLGVDALIPPNYIINQQAKRVNVSYTYDMERQRQRCVCVCLELKIMIKTYNKANLFT